MVRLGSLALVCNVPQEVNRIVIEVVGYRERMQCMCFGKKKEMFDVKEQWLSDQKLQIVTKKWFSNVELNEITKKS